MYLCFTPRIKLASCARFIGLHKSAGLRMSSSLVGASGRVYVRDKLLKSHPKNPIYLAHLFLSRYSNTLTPKQAFADTTQLRTHVDVNEDDRVLIYEYFTHDLLSLVQNNEKLPLKARKSILQQVGKAVAELHAKIHLDIKPDNVMIDGKESNEGQFEIERVALSDLDCALELEGEKLLNARIGNVMWRSPEAQIGKGVGKPGDVFSYGLLCLYVITGVETLHPDFQELKEAGIEHELEIMSRLITFFGPVPPELITYVNDPKWGRILKDLSEATAGDPSMRFNQWTEEMFPNLDAEAKRVIFRMTNLNPTERATMLEILQDPWWRNDTTGS